MFELKFEVESFIDFFISLHEVLQINEISDSAFDCIETVFNSMKDRFVSIYGGECDSN